MRLVLSDRLKGQEKNQEFPPLIQQCFHALEGKPLRSPKRFAPDQVALAYHRQNVFR